jgi:ribosomal protein S18 acetylase RimI-like enzyme
LNEWIEIKDASVACDDAVLLLAELNAALTKITGASGEVSFAAEDVANERSAFVIAYVNGMACGCGALRPLTDTIAEIKRVYARPNSIGVGTAIVRALEAKAREFGYTEIVLETRKVNVDAVAFYRKLGYVECANYGKYKGGKLRCAWQRKYKILSQDITRAIGDKTSTFYPF